MSSAKMKNDARRPGKPDLSMLDKKTQAFIDAGAEERAAAPLPASPAASEDSARRIPKIPVSLRLPQTITDKVMEMAATETLRTKMRVTPHDIYLRAIAGYISNVS